MLCCHTQSLLFSYKVRSDSLWPHKLQHTKLPCSSLSPRVCSNSCPLSQWCHPTISSSVASFSSCPQSFPASGSFPTSLLFASDGQSIGASASVFPVNIQGWFPLRLIGFDLLAVQETLRLSDYRTIIYPPLGPSLSTSLLPLTAECLSRTCIQLKGTASLKVTMPLWGQHISNAWSIGWIQRSGSLTSMGTSLSGQPSSRAPMRPPEVSAARCIGTQFFPLPHSVSLTSSQILILHINLPTVHLHINLHFRICVPRN